MEAHTTDLKEDDSFEILPHLNEYDIFLDTQKYRFLNKYGNNFTTEETISMSSSNVWNISETEFYDLRNPLASDTESDIILKPCPDLVTDGTLSISQHTETLTYVASIQELVPYSNTHEEPVLKPKSEFNATNIELVPYSHDADNPVTEEKQLKTKTGRNLLQLRFQLNDTERIVEAFSDEIGSTTADGNFQIARNVILNGGEDENLTGRESTRGNSGNKTGTASMPRKETTKTRAVVKPYRGRSKSSRRICEAVNNGINLYKWFQRNPVVRTVVEGAKSSFNSFVNLFELDYNRMMGIEEEPLNLTIVTEESHCRAIEEAFSAIFRGRVSFSWMIPVEDSIPALPVGHVAGVQAAEMKIHCARQNVGDTALISTSTLLYEAIPQRWQMATAICLDDPKLNLQLHNFTLSTPIPNEYVAEVERWTPTSYSHRDTGLAVSLEQAISNLIPVTVTDAQEFLTGFNSYTTLKSAALVLAGMYKKYV